MDLYAPAQTPRMLRGHRDTRVHSRFVVRRRLGPHQSLNQIKQTRLFASRASQQRAHGDGGINSSGHFKTFHVHSYAPKPGIS
jgi:hypothetical protein